MIRMVELFAGIGVPSLAAKTMFRNVIIADVVEKNKWAMKSYNLLHDTNFETKDIKKYNWTGGEQIDLVHISPPCVDFSIAGKQQGAKGKNGKELWEHSLRIVKQIDPYVVVVENVKGLLKHKEVMDWWMKEMRKLGYINSWRDVNSINHYCAQHRERVVIVSHRPFFVRFDYWSDNPLYTNENEPIKEWYKIHDILDNSTEAFFERLPKNKFVLKNKLDFFPKATIHVKKDAYSCVDINKILRFGKLKNKNNKDVSFNNKSSFYGIEGFCGSISASDAQYTKFMSVAKDWKGCFWVWYRKATLLEIFWLFGLDRKHYSLLQDKIPEKEIYKQLGNSIVLNTYQYVLYSIFKHKIWNERKEYESNNSNRSSN